MKRKELLTRCGVWACVLLTAGLLLIKMNTQALSFCANLVMQSAKTNLPVLPTTVVPPQTTLPPTVPEATTAAPQTEPSTVQSAAEAVQTAAPDDLTVTPQDILERMAKAQAAAKSDEAGGKLLEKQYTTEGVTDKKGVVRVKNTNETEIDLAALLKKKADLSVDAKAPTVLIFHTHTTETYQLLDRAFWAKDFASRSSDSGQNMVRVGDEICAALEKAGFSVLHDTEIHDARYTGAYDRSRESVQAYLKKYPSLQVTLDIHRDAIQLSNGTKLKPTATINGKKAAQVMIISGCQEEGNGVTDFPDWEQNLVFALQLQKQMEQTFPGLTRPLFFCPRRYNMNLTHCSLLIEVGSDGNTLEEAAYSGRCIGQALAALLQKYQAA